MSSTLETVLVYLIVAAVVLWALRGLWRMVRPRNRVPGCGTCGPHGCPMAEKARREAGSGVHGLGDS